MSFEQLSAMRNALVDYIEAFERIAALGAYTQPGIALAIKHAPLLLELRPEIDARRADLAGKRGSAP